MTQSLNIKRHISVFDPTPIKTPVHIIGCGATGSSVALSLAKLGMRNVTVWDGDKVESHNIPNQVFFPRHIGENKAKAMQSMVEEIAPTQAESWEFYGTYYSGQIPLMGIVFLLVDSMEERRILWENHIELKPAVKMMFETRINPFSGRLYSIRPSNITDVKLWERNCYDDRNADTSLCGTTSTLGPTASIVANIAVLQMIHWLIGDDDHIISPEILIDLKDMSTLKP